MNMLQAVPLLSAEDLRTLGWGLARFSPEGKWLRCGDCIKSIDPDNWRTFMFRDLDQSVQTLKFWHDWLHEANDPYKDILRIINVLEKVKARDRARNKGLQKLRECGNEVAPELRD